MDQTLTGVVFDIREFTVHDGPGVRTTVFLKGCPLRCAWCHNPEGLTPEPQLMHAAGVPARVVGRRYSAAELAVILNRQAPLLRDAGGVSFSGGEPLQQARFVAAVIDRLEGLHVTLGTSGYASEGDFRLVSDRCNLVLFDLKLFDSRLHMRWTGQDNRPILRNLSVLAGSETPFVVRVPLVPGVTDMRENLEGIATHLATLPRRPRIELMRYNRAAGGKYAPCGMQWRPTYDEDAVQAPDLSAFAERALEVSFA